MHCWFVVNTKPKKEFHVERLFQEGGIVSYLPKYLKKDKPAPFFPGYAFVFFDYNSQYHLIKFTRGVKAIVRQGAYPAPVDEALINEIRSQEREGYIELVNFYGDPNPGDEVEIMEGPLKGIRGIFSRELKDKDRVAILMRYVAYQAQVMIERCKLKKVGA